MAKDKKVPRHTGLLYLDFRAVKTGQSYPISASSLHQFPRLILRFYCVY